MRNTVDEYVNEPVRYPALTIVDLEAEGASVVETYRNIVINRINDSCLRLAVFEGEYRWHKHPTSDELFIVIDGCLVIDLENGAEFRLSRWQSVTIPAGTVHRTRAIGRTVNLCFELLASETVFLDDGQEKRNDPSLSELPNLGTKSLEMLALAGITSVAKLRELGAVAAYCLAKETSSHASLNLLWAIEGALIGLPWQVVARDHRGRLLLELEKYQSGES